MYKNVQINESVTFQGSTLASCYLKITRVAVDQISNLQAFYAVNIYESKAKHDLNEGWTITIDEIPSGMNINFTADFNQGDLFQKISDSLVAKLLELQPTWLEANLIIEA